MMLKQKFSFVHRFVALLLMFVGFCVTVTYLLIVAKNGPIHFGQQEIKGNAYQRSLEKVMFNVMQHRIASSRATNSEKALLEKLPDLQSQVNDSFAKLAGEESKLEKALQLTDEGLKAYNREHYRSNTIYKEWSELKEKLPTQKPEESDEQHVHIISDLRTLIIHVGDTSNLGLDPDLDSFYLRDITLLALPQAQERIQNVIVELGPIILRGKATAEEKTNASLFAAMMNESDLARINTSHKATLLHDEKYYGKSPTLEGELNAANKKFAEAYFDLMVIASNLGAGKVVSHEKFVEVSQKAFNEGSAYWKVASIELDKLLEIRVNQLTESKTAAIAGSVLFLLFTLSIAFVFVRYMVKNMRSIVGVLDRSSQKVSEASTQSAATATQLSEASAEQAASLQQTMATIEQISAMVSQNASSAQKTKVVVDENYQVSEKGTVSFEQMALAIDEIKATNDEIMNQMENSNIEFSQIVSIIGEIAKKTNVINEIVFQTKLLSFNASIEAARAGEHGKGFAVVADEVGNLAQMSGNAAKEISDMLSASVKKVNVIVENTKSRVAQMVEVGKDKIIVGQSTAAKCKVSLHHMTQNAVSIAKMITEISQASHEQAQGIGEIIKAFAQLDQATQQNAVTAQESSNQAEQLNSESLSLAKAVVELVTFMDGAKKEVPKKPIAQKENKFNSKPEVVVNKVVRLDQKRIEKVNSKKKAATTEAGTVPQALKKVSGISTVPSANDPNFEEF